ncbi:hypothetical protein BKA81DRAFT_375847 [Phyllosticta paracitricarpa]|uniref:Uncharacterized protein n=1 Tax=Phyllosticta citricarpa TaxID=55181 RepID=A0ABR1MIR6_9PEZI
MSERTPRHSYTSMRPNVDDEKRRDAKDVSERTPSHTVARHGRLNQTPGPMSHRPDRFHHGRESATNAHPRSFAIRRSTSAAQCRLQRGSDGASALALLLSLAVSSSSSTHASAIAAAAPPNDPHAGTSQSKGFSTPGQACPADAVSRWNAAIHRSKNEDEPSCKKAPHRDQCDQCVVGFATAMTACIGAYTASVSACFARYWGVELGWGGAGL